MGWFPFRSMGPYAIPQQAVVSLRVIRSNVLVPPVLIVEDHIVVELKAVKELADVHFAQLRSYLKATSLKVGLLINFAKPTLEVKRVVN